MLVLNRKEGESIQIGKNISIKIIEIKGQQLKIGVDAPKDVQILRSELYNEVSDMNMKSMVTTKVNLESIPSFIKEKKDNGSNK